MVVVLIAWFSVKMSVRVDQGLLTKTRSQFTSKDPGKMV
jgi:hypothetical protein